MANKSDKNEFSQQRRITDEDKKAMAAHLFAEVHVGRPREEVLEELHKKYDRSTRQIERYLEQVRRASVQPPLAAVDAARAQSLKEHWDNLKATARDLAQTHAPNLYYLWPLERRQPLRDVDGLLELRQPEIADYIDRNSYRYLKEHLEVDPEWANNLAKLKKLVGCMDAAMCRLANCIDRESESRTGLPCRPQMAQQYLLGSEGLGPYYTREAFRAALEPDNLCLYHCDEFIVRANNDAIMARVSDKSRREVVIQVHKALVEELSGWPEFQQLSDDHQEVKSALGPLTQKLISVSEMVFFPGRCRACS